MKANGCKSYLSYVNKSVDQYINTYRHSLNKTPINNNYSPLTEKTLRRILKLLSLKLMIESKILIIFCKGDTKNWLREIFITDFVLKTNLSACKIKDLNGEKILNFYKKRIVAEYIINKYYPEPDSHIRNKVKLELDLSNYAFRKELDHVTGVDTPDLAAKKIHIHQCNTDI